MSDGKESGDKGGDKDSSRKTLTRKSKGRAK